MRYTRIFTDASGDSRFEDLDIPLHDQGQIGRLSQTFGAKEIRFRENDANYDWDFHNAPAHQFILLLDGEIEITTSTGDIRRFRGGDIVLVEDTEGKGHKTRQCNDGVRRSVFIVLND